MSILTDESEKKAITADFKKVDFGITISAKICDIIETFPPDKDQPFPVYSCKVNEELCVIRSYLENQLESISERLNIKIKAKGSEIYGINRVYYLLKENLINHDTKINVIDIRYTFDSEELEKIERLRLRTELNEMIKLFIEEELNIKVFGCHAAFYI